MYSLLPHEERLYKDYYWCLDPMPRWQVLATLFRQELERWNGDVKGWIEREHALNCFLMAAALWQTLSDYLVRDQLFSGLGGRSAREPSISGTLNARVIRMRNRVIDRRILETDARWRYLLKKLAKSLLDPESTVPEYRRDIASLAAGLLQKRYPGMLRRTRVRIPSAFRSQDFTHHDFITLVEEFVRGGKDRFEPLVVVGVRPIGAYCGPLAQACLEQKGFAVQEMITLHPGGGSSLLEENAIREGLQSQARFIVMDEPSRNGTNTGDTVRYLRGRGVPPKKISVLFPVYPAHLKWRAALISFENEGIEIITLPWNRWYKVEVLKVENIRRLLVEYCAGQGRELVSVEESPRGKYVDSRFGNPERIGWRLKQVYQVKMWDRSGREHTEEILAKSVGWGYLGYHAYIQADRLHDFVPPLLGLRQGLLFMQWITGTSGKSAHCDIDRMIPHVLRYITARTDRLSLAEDMTFREYSRHFHGSQFLCWILSRAFGRHLGPVLRHAVWKLLERYTTRSPTAIDGKIAPEDWIITGETLRKIDFEHHGFGATELNIADPVFDVASFIFEFRLTESQRVRVLAEYERLTGDAAAREKVPLYLWLIAHVNLRNERDYLDEPLVYRRSVEENRKYIGDREYINLLSAGYVRSHMPLPAGTTTNGVWIVFDIDDVLNHRTWEFPAATASGIRALSLLRRHGFRLIASGTRSIGEIRVFCDSFNLDGGIAEYGGVVWDARRTREIGLVDGETAEEIVRMRRLLLEFPTIFLNPHYRTLIHAYHHRNRETMPLDPERIRKMIRQYGFSRIRVFEDDRSTIIASKKVDTGRALRLLARQGKEKPRSTVAVIAAGTGLSLASAADMVIASRRRAAEINAAGIFPEIIFAGSGQESIAQAARLAIRRFSTEPSGAGRPWTAAPEALLMHLLEVAEKPRLGRMVSAVKALTLGS